MKINLFTNVGQNNTPGAVNRNQSGYLTKNISPSFAGLHLLGRKSASDSVEIAKEVAPSVRQVIKSVEKIWKKHAESDFIIDKHIKTLRKLINKDNIPFVNKLLQRAEIEADNNNPVNIGRIADLTEKYNEYPQSRNLMQKAVDAQIEGQPRFSIHELAEEGIFRRMYNGSEDENNLIESMIDAKDLDGSPRFYGSAINKATMSLSPEKREIIDILLAQTKTAPAEKDFKKLAILIQESVDARIVKSIREYESVYSRRTSLDSVVARMGEATLPAKNVYLIDKNGSYLDYILPNYTHEKLYVLTQILPRVKDASEIAPILKHYTPEPSFFEENSIAKAMSEDFRRAGFDAPSFFDTCINLVDAGKLTMKELPELLKAVGKKQS